LLADWLLAGPAPVSAGGTVVIPVVRRLGDITPQVLGEATTIAMMSTLGSARELAGQVACSLAGLGPLTVAQRSVTTSAVPGALASSRQTDGAAFHLISADSPIITGDSHRVN
jgi:hypothetical protein